MRQHYPSDLRSKADMSPTLCLQRKGRGHFHKILSVLLVSSFVHLSMQNIGFSRCSLCDVSCLEFLASIDCHASAILSMITTSTLRTHACTYIHGLNQRRKEHGEENENKK